MSKNSHIEFDLIRQADPFGGLDGQARAEAVRKVGEEARQLFTTNVAELDRIIRSVNPMQLLAHFAFYDQLWLDGKGDSYGYTPTQQSAVEWLQALILRIPESEISAVLDSPPGSEVLLKTNALLTETQRAWGMMRIGDKDTSPAGLVCEMVRQQTAFVRNEGYLESRTYEIVRNALPVAQVYRGLKWADQVDQVEGENDVLALLDSHALVFECKSGRLRALAARGEPKALSGDIEKLMGDPAAQAGRFAKFLLRQKGVVR